MRLSGKFGLLTTCLVLIAACGGPAQVPARGTQALPPSSSEAQSPVKEYEDEILSGISSANRKLMDQYFDRSFQELFSPHARALIGIGIREKVTGEAYRVLLDRAFQNYANEHAASGLLVQLAASFAEPSERDVSDVGANARRIQQGYERMSTKLNEESFKYSVGRTLIKGNAKLLDTVLDYGSKGAVVSGNVPAAITLGVLKYGFEFANSKIIEEFERNRKEMALKLLSGAMNTANVEMREAWSQLPLLEPERARTEAVRLAKLSTEDLIQAVPGEDRELAQRVVQKSLTEAALGELAREGSWRRIADQKLQGQINENTQGIVAIGKTFAKFSGETNSRLAEIQNLQQEIHTGLGEIEGRVKSIENDTTQLKRQMGEVASDVNFLQDYMFSRMTVQEQRASLASGAYGRSLTPSQRAELDRKLELVDKRQRLQELMSDVVAGGQLFLKLGDRLGVPPRILATAGKAIAALDVGSKIFNAFSSGSGYMGAAMAFTDFIGLGGPDAATQRHEQIMGTLNELLEGQKKMLELQVESIRMQRQIIQNQMLMFEALSNLSDQIQRSFEVVSSKLDRIEREISEIKQTTRIIALKNVLECRSFLLKRGKHAYDSMRKFSRYSDFSRFFNENKDSYERCLSGLTDQFENDEVSQTTLVSWLYADTNQEELEALHFIDNLFTPAVSYLGRKAEARSFVSMEAPFLSFLFPMANFAALSAKNDAIRAMARPVTGFPAGEIHELLAHPISVRALTRYTDSLIEMAPYVEFIGVTSSAGFGNIAPPIEQVLAIRDTNLKNNRAKYMLEGALRHLNIAIAQESMLSGDMILPELYQDFTHPMFNTEADKCGGTIPSTAGNPLCVLENNRLLRENFVLYALQRDIRESGYSVRNYQWAVRRPVDPLAFKTITRKPWAFHWCEAAASEEPCKSGVAPKGWSVRIGSHYVALPVEGRFFDAPVAYRPELEILHARKQQVVQLLGAYGYDEQADGEERGLMTYLLLKGN